MIIRTQIKTAEKKTLSEYEKAKREMLQEEGIHYDNTDEDYEEVLKEAMIDTKEGLVYIQANETTVDLQRLLDAQYVYDEENRLIMLNDKVTFTGTLDELESKLK